MSPNNSKKILVFVVIFGTSNHNEKYPNKKANIKKTFWLQPQAHVSLQELQK